MIHFARGSIVSTHLVAGGPVRLDGRLEGSVAALRVEVGPDGYVVGDVHADEVVVHGQVLGDIRARKVVLMPSALVEGDITHTVLALDEGAILMGECMAERNIALPDAVALLVARGTAEDDALDRQQRLAFDEPGSVRIRIARGPAGPAEGREANLRT